MQKIPILLMLFSLLSSGGIALAGGEKCETLKFKDETIHRCESVDTVFFRKGTWQEAVSRGIARKRDTEKIRLVQNLLHETGIILNGNM